MCKKSIQLEIIKKLEITKNKAPARSLFYRNPDEKHLFFFLLGLKERGKEGLKTKTPSLSKARTNNNKSSFCREQKSPADIVPLFPYKN